MVESQQLEEELAMIEADDSIEPEKKREMMYDLLRQFGAQNRPFNPDKDDAVSQET